MKKLRKSLLIVILLVFLINISVGAVFTDNEIKNLYSIKNEFEVDFNKQVANLRINLLMRLGHYPSVSACVINNESISWYGGYGRAKLFPKQEPSPNTIYAIGSISKTVTATAIMQLCTNCRECPD